MTGGIPSGYGLSGLAHRLEQFSKERVGEATTLAEQADNLSRQVESFLGRVKYS